MFAVYTSIKRTHIENLASNFYLFYAVCYLLTNNTL